MTFTTIDWYVTAATLRSAFELQFRKPDQHGNRSEFYALTEQARQSTDDLLSFVYELHDGELANDWRWKTIVQILDAIIEDSKDDCDSDHWDNFPFAVADELTSIYTSELFNWLAEYPNRQSYHDDAIEDNLVVYEADLCKRVIFAQYRCIQEMASCILSKLGIPNQS